MNAFRHLQSCKPFSKEGVLTALRYYCSSSSKDIAPRSLNSKYNVYKDEDSEIIFDIYEEQYKKQQTESEVKNPLEGIDLQRGESGVFDIESLVDVLKRENGSNIFVATVPKQIAYVDHVCLVSCDSARHMQALMQLTRKVFKAKRNSSDTVPKVEGRNANDWMALDLGNIALHVFSHEARAKYDLDTLWAVGSEFDDLANQKDEFAELIDSETLFLKQLQPAS